MDKDILYTATAVQEIRTMSEDKLEKLNNEIEDFRRIRKSIIVNYEPKGRCWGFAYTDERYAVALGL